MKPPNIPMVPGQLPQQRLNVVPTLPDRPAAFDSIAGWQAVPDDILPKSKNPRNAAYLGQVEWAWSPAHERLDAYYIHRSRRFWILWILHFDDNWEKWEWLPVGSVPLRQATEKEAAVHLLIDFWKFAKDNGSLDHFHWINEGGFLSVEEWREVGRTVWPD